MKKITLLLILILAIGGSAYAQTAPSDTSVTTAAEGTYPPGTSYNGVPLGGLQISAGSVIAGDGTTADGRIGIRLLGIPDPITGSQQVISIDAVISGGSRAAANVATISGTCSIDMGNGLPPVTGVPIVATVATDANNLGGVTLTLGSTQLPGATMTAGSMAVADMDSTL
jgi:hypothetical protein